jgi:predicted nucleic acid-binding protein
LIVPTFSVYEVFERILQQRCEGDALQAIAVMIQETVIDLGLDLALSAAKVSTDLKLPMADSVMLSTAQTHDAILWTQDADFEGVDGVRYIEKR